MSNKLNPITMDEELKVQKHKFSNDLRLESIKRRKLEKSAQKKYISDALNCLDKPVTKNKKIIFDLDNEDLPLHTTSTNQTELTKKSEKEKLTLFDSSDSEEDAQNDEDRFKIKKQFEGERGRELFEFSSQITDSRFKLDERFREDDDDELLESNLSLNPEDEFTQEKEKNLEILEEVLGFQLPKKHPEEKQRIKQKKYLRFDPESTNAPEFIRKQDYITKETKKKMKTTKKEPEVEKPIVSKERFFEVATNLKDLFHNSDENFTLSSTFGFPEDLEKDSLFKTTSINTDDTSEHIGLNNENKERKKMTAESSSVPVVDNNNFMRKTFFMQPNDQRLKEGVEFFHWTTPLDTIREQWPTMREILTEAYKKNRSSSFHRVKQKPRGFQKTKKYFK